MQRNTLLRHGISTLAMAALVMSGLQLAQAAPSVRRLTPPSALFSTGDPSPPIIARFLPGQRFDLQATISPDAGQTITAVQFAVDSVPVPGTVSFAAATAAGQPPGTVVASLRAYSNDHNLVHLLSITAWQSDNQVVTRQGNFEVIEIKKTGLAAKNLIIMIGDGMG